MSATNTTTPTPAYPELHFAAPGPGSWKNERSHCLGSITPVVQDLMSTAMENGMRTVFADLGVPADTLEAKFVNGFMYTRMRPLIGGDRASTKLPPVPILKLVMRLHPEMRRRTKTAAASLAGHPWRAVIRDWSTTTRPALRAENLALEVADLGAMDDPTLLDHLDAVHAHNRRTWTQHFILHGYDLGPIGMLVAAADQLGVPIAVTAAALEGASPSSSAPTVALAELRRIAHSADPRPTTIEALRAVSGEADRLVTDYLLERGQLVVTRYDVDGLTLNELPDLLMAAILRGNDHVRSDQTVARQALLDAVPAHERPKFDGLLDEARAAMDLRDDNGPNTVEWPLGLLRRAMLETGRRLQRVGRLLDPTHAFERMPADLRTMLTTGGGPSAVDVAEEASARMRRSAVVPPLTLGPTEVEPPLAALPAPLATLVATVNAVIVHLGMDGADRTATPLTGSGVGREPYRGRACRADTPEEAIDLLEAGDVLVVPFTTPAYNVVLPLAGAIVTVDGGPLSHAAVLARELGISAVVGAPGALAQIAHHDIVEVDPRTGTVRVLARASVSERAIQHSPRSGEH